MTRLTIPDDLAAQIDAIRGDSSRSEYAEAMLRQWLASRDYELGEEVPVAPMIPATRRAPLMRRPSRVRG
jgi:metal-responsive CopG/Arc/MetJ family transcriptional regulator